jgi:uncharacterized DUF497 family protein
VPLFPLIVEWDEAKRANNIRGHNIDFVRARTLWQGPVLETASNQTHHGEIRMLATGLLDGEFITVVFTWRVAARRLISGRPARRRERENYASHHG